MMANIGLDAVVVDCMVLEICHTHRWPSVSFFLFSSFTFHFFGCWKVDGGGNAVPP